MKYIKKFESIIDRTKVTELNIREHNLDELNHLDEYTNLKKLYCYLNKLETLPELPESLKTLYCDNNNLKSLPELPESLEKLYCKYNNLPFENLNEYKEWYDKYKHIIKSEGLEYTYELSRNLNKYNM